MQGNPLRGKTALITGAARRLGRALALALADEGVAIVAHYATSAEEAESLRADVERRGVACHLIQARFDRPDETQSLVPRALAAAGALDILVNSASIFRPDTLAEVDFGSLTDHMRVNAWTPLVLGREMARLVGRGQILNLLDTRVIGGDPAHVAYILSKQMLASLTRMMALEFAPGIAVNAIAPGLILPPPGHDEEYLRGLAGALPLQRHGEPADIVDAALYLLGSTFVTGQVIYVDGGRHLREESPGKTARVP
jgi:NAD(P)-dependent dehydrogenase (short-subunit alcohol dehydrogenase family)